MTEKDVEREQKMRSILKELNDCKKDYMILEERSKGVMEINRMLEEGIEREKREKEEDEEMEHAKKDDGEDTMDMYEKQAS